MKVNFTKINPTTHETVLNKLSAAETRVRELTEQTVRLSAEVTRMTKARFKPIPAARKASTGKEWMRVIIPDSHGCHAEGPAVAAFLEDLGNLNPREIVMLGDHVDCGGFLAQHHTLGYVAEADYSYANDCEATNEFLNQIQKRAPNAKIYYIEGNHERRVESWCITETLRHAKDAEMLRRAFAPEFRLNLAERGIDYFRRGVFYNNLPLPGTIKLGKCFFTHGISTSKHAASVHVARFAGNIVYGDTHRGDWCPTRLVNVGIVSAWNPGCLCQLQPLWGETKPTEWSHGYALQLVQDNGEFLHVQVPIIRGKSLLGPMVRNVTAKA